MSAFQQLRTHLGKLFVFLSLIAFLSFYYLHGLPSTTLASVPDPDAHSPSLAFLGPTSDQKHPIEVLVEDARRKHAHIVESQSKSLEQAIANYKKRYHREPPPGFDDWYNTAVRLNATIIDEYDTVMAMFEPYWGISARELRARVREALDPRLLDGKMFGIQVKNHELFTVNEKTAGTGTGQHNYDILQDRMQPFLQFLPDMEYAYNAFDEPGVFVPHDVLQRAISECPTSDEEEDTADPWEINTEWPSKVYFSQDGKERTWDIGTRSCSLDSPARSLLSSRPIQENTTDEEEWPSFPQNIGHIRNICELPGAGNMHGIFLSPTGLWQTETLVPVFSHSKVSSNQDLLMPAPDYSSAMTPFYKPYDESQDIPWDQKENQLYWMGGMTDGYFADSRWKTSQRFRFVKDFNNGSKPISLLRQNIESSSWEPYKATMEALSRYVDVKFSDRVWSHCSEAVCEEMKDPKEGLVIAKIEPMEAPYGSKFAFDIDGHSYTERFRRLLQSHNTVFKMTIFQETHDDFLVPWVHYVPVSLGMKELPETLRFFVETEKGQEIGKAIAEDGRRWVEQAWRPVDMKIAFFRILLEYGRLWGPARDKFGECPWNRQS